MDAGDFVIIDRLRKKHCGPTLLSTSEGTSMPKMEKQKTPNLIFELYD